MTDATHEERPTIDIELVRSLVAEQFPRWADLDIRPVEFDGWDNRTFRLGEHLTVRLPSASGYVAAVEKEQRWLPYLAPHLSLPIPVPLGAGVPGCGYPFPWSVNPWIDGDTALHAQIDDLADLATTLAGFLTELQSVGTTDGPLAGAHSFFRGGALSTYETGTRTALEVLGDRVDRAAATAVWERGLASHWTREPVWFHGDVAGGNLLVRDGRLCAVIDFGTSGVGDPACDLAIAWTLLTPASRAAFRAGLDLDEDTWARGRAWTLWKALITLAPLPEQDPATAEPRRVLEAVLDDACTR